MSTQKAILVVYQDDKDDEDTLAEIRSLSGCGLMTPIEIKTGYWACCGLTADDADLVSANRGKSNLRVQREEEDTDTVAFQARAMAAIRSQLGQMKAKPTPDFGIWIKESDFKYLRGDPEFDKLQAGAE